MFYPLNWMPMRCGNVRYEKNMKDKNKKQFFDKDKRA